MNSLRTAKRFVFPLLGLWVLLYASFSLLKPPMLDGADSLQAEAAREMAAAHDWITPHLDGVRSFAVPALPTWLIATSFKIFGVNDWAARLPQSFAALTLFLVALSLASRIFSTPIAGFYAALILATSSGIFLFAHLLYPHLLCTLWMTTAFYFFWRSLRKPTLKTAIGFALSLALGSLTLGVAGALLPVLVVALFLFFTRDLSHLLHWHPAAMTAVFCAVALPWRFLAHNANPHHPYLSALPRPATTPILLFWALLLVWLLPWTFFSVAEFGKLSGTIFNRTKAHTEKLDCRRQGLLLLTLWLAVVLIWFSIFQRHEFSLVPALPPLAMLGAAWLAADEAAPSRYGRIVAWILFVAGMVKAVVAVVLGLRAPFPGFAADISTLLNLHTDQHPQFFGYLRDLTFASMGAFRIPLLILAAALAVGVTLNLVFRLQGKARLANCFLAGMMAFVLIAAHIALNTFSPVFSSAILAEAIKPEVEQGDAVVIDGRYEDASALGFYLQRPIQILSTPAGDLAPGSLAPDAPPVFLDQNALAKLWDGPGRVFLWTTPVSIPQLPGESYVIARDGGREIVSNEPNNGGAAF